MPLVWLASFYANELVFDITIAKDIDKLVFDIIITKVVVNFKTCGYI